jgi:hypothetical protein
VHWEQKIVEFRVREYNRIEEGIENEGVFLSDEVINLRFESLLGLYT